MLVPNSELTYDSLSSIREENDKDIESQKEDKETCSYFITKIASQNQDIVCCCGSFICTFACITVPTFVLLYYFA